MPLALCFVELKPILILFVLNCFFDLVFFHRSLHPEKMEELDQLRKHLVESRHEMAPMKVWQLQHLSMQAAQRIMSAPRDQQLSLFVHTAQNFPVLARSLVRVKVGFTWTLLLIHISNVRIFLKCS